MESAATTRHWNDLSDAQTGGTFLDDKGRDFPLGAVVRMRGKDREQVRHRRVGYVPLGAVEDVRITTPSGGRLQCGCVRARPLFGQCIAACHTPARKGW